MTVYEPPINSSNFWHTSGDGVPGGAVGDAALLVEVVLVVGAVVARFVLLGHEGVVRRVRQRQLPERHKIKVHLHRSKPIPRTGLRSYN